MSLVLLRELRQVSELMTFHSTEKYEDLKKCWIRVSSSWNCHIHPSIHQIGKEGGGVLEPIPADIGQRGGGGDRFPEYHMVDLKRHSQIHTYGRVSINLFGLCGRKPGFEPTTTPLVSHFTSCPLRSLSSPLQLPRSLSDLLPSTSTHHPRRRAAADGWGLDSLWLNTSLMGFSIFPEVYRGRTCGHLLP